MGQGGLSGLSTGAGVPSSGIFGQGPLAGAGGGLTAGDASSFGGSPSTFGGVPQPTASLGSSSGMARGASGSSPQSGGGGVTPATDQRVSAAVNKVVSRME